MNGLSTGINIGYAQVLKPTDQSDYFKLAANMQKTADALKQKKVAEEDKDKDVAGKHVSGILGKMPKKVYSEHTKYFEEQKQALVEKGKKAVESNDYAAMADFDYEANRILTEAEQSLNFQNQINHLPSKDRATYSRGTQAYIEDIKKGFDKDGNILLQVDQNKFIKKPNYSDLFSQDQAYTDMVKPLESDSGYSTSPSSIPGVHFQENTRYKTRTKEQIKSANDYKRKAIVGTPEFEQIYVDYIEGLQAGEPEYKKFENLAKVDANTNQVDYTDAALEYFISKSPYIPEVSSKKMRQPIYDKTNSRGGYGDDNPYFNTSIESTEMSNPIYQTEVSKDPKQTGAQGRFQYVDITLPENMKIDDLPSEFVAEDSDGNKKPQIKYDPNNGKYYNLTGEKDITNKVKEYERSKGVSFDTQTQTSNVDVEKTSFNKTTKLQLNVPWYIDSDGNTVNTGINTGIKTTTDDIQIFSREYDDKNKSFDVRRGGSKKKGVFMTVHDSKGNLITVPLDEASYKEVENAVNKDINDSKYFWKSQIWKHNKGVKSNSTKKAEQKSVTSGQKQPASKSNDRKAKADKNLKDW